MIYIELEAQAMLFAITRELPIKDISEEMRKFIFNHIDSIEQLEVLFLLRNHLPRKWTVFEISSELRSSPESILKRIESNRSTGLIRTIDDTGSRLFEYYATDVKLENMVEELAVAYRNQPHRIIELIYSPTKRVRSFASAFVMRDPDLKKGENG